VHVKYSYLFILWVGVVLSACGPSAARYNNDGNQEYAAEKYDEALRNYTSAQRENPDLPEPYYNAGNAFHRKDEFEAAIAQTQQSLRTAPDELAEQSHYNLGNNFFKLQEWEAAIEAYKEALRLKPDDADAKHNLELAQQMLQQQQQQQQQGQQGQSQGDQPQPQQQGGGQQPQPQQQGGQQGDQPQDQQGGGNQGQEQQDQSQSSGGNQPQEQEQSGNGSELSPEEAQQLLDALGQNSQTLQERLNQIFGEGSSDGGFGGAPKPLPAQDW
jgi:Ca-activated chloride channel family protein